MGLNDKKIAVLCNYELLPERVGGMDQFFWRFDAKCKENGVAVDWFFPNRGSHQGYAALTIFPKTAGSIETTFLRHCEGKPKEYSHIITHFLELCTPFYKQIKQLTAAKVIAVDHNPRPLLGYPFKKKLGKRLKGFLYSRYIDVFVGVSAQTQGEMVKDFGSPIRNKTLCIYNGIEMERYIKKEDFNGFDSFMVACHIRKEKGIQDLSHASLK